MNTPYKNTGFVFRLMGQFTSPSAARLLSVPFFPHEVETAGSAALAMILNFYGMQISVQRVADDLGGDGWSSRVNPQALSHAAQNYGFNARVTCGDLYRLAEWLEGGIPPLVFSARAGQADGEPVAVVTGLSPSRDAVRVHYGTTPHRWLRAAEFMTLCGGEAFTALVVTGKICPSGSKARVNYRPLWSGFPSSLPVLDTVCAVAA